MDWQASLKFPLYYVEWSDPTSSDSWEHITEIKHEPNTIKSCGFLIYDKDSCIVLALNVDEEEDSSSCMMIIPKSLIVRKFNVLDKTTDI